jgi:hypothetical protein
MEYFAGLTLGDAAEVVEDSVADRCPAVGIRRTWLADALTWAVIATICRHQVHSRAGRGAVIVRENPPQS